MAAINQRINCTVVELKLGSKQLKRIGFGSINCTVVELKLKERDWNLIATLGINCTVVELKQNLRNRSKTRENVLIVPLWN